MGGAADDADDPGAVCAARLCASRRRISLGEYLSAREGVERCEGEEEGCVQFERCSLVRCLHGVSPSKLQPCYYASTSTTVVATCSAVYAGQLAYSTEYGFTVRKL